MSKKFLLGAAAVAGSLATFAEGDVTADSILTQAQTSLSSLLTTAIPIVGGMVVAGLGIWGVMKLLGLLKRAFGFGTGR